MRPMVNLCGLSPCWQPCGTKLLGCQPPSQRRLQTSEIGRGACQPALPAPALQACTCFPRGDRCSLPSRPEHSTAAAPTPAATTRPGEGRGDPTIPWHRGLGHQVCPHPSLSPFQTTHHLPWPAHHHRVLGVFLWTGEALLGCRIHALLPATLATSPWWPPFCSWHQPCRASCPPAALRWGGCVKQCLPDLWPAPDLSPVPSSMAGEL